jgi:hypothetical protein
MLITLALAPPTLAADIRPRAGLFPGSGIVVAVYDARETVQEGLAGRISATLREVYPDAKIEASSDFDEIAANTLTVRLEVAESENHTTVSYGVRSGGFPSVGTTVAPPEANVSFDVEIIDSRVTGAPRHLSRLTCSSRATSPWSGESGDDVEARAWTNCVRDLVNLIDPFSRNVVVAAPARAVSDVPPASTARFAALLYRVSGREPAADPAVLTDDIRAVWECVQRGMEASEIQVVVERGAMLVPATATLRQVLQAGQQPPAQ